MPCVVRRITSPSNPLVRTLVNEAAGRGSLHVVLEGPHLVEEGLRSPRVRVRHLFMLDEEGRREEFAHLLQHPSLCGADVILSSPSVVRKLSSTRTPQAVLAVGEFQPWVLGDIIGQTAGLVVVCDAVQDPGNVGALIRTSDAAGAAGVLLLPGCADPHGTKTLRSTAGSLFHLPVVRTERGDDLVVLRESGYRIFGVQAHGGGDLFDTVFPEKTVMVFGSEGQGLSDGARALCEGFFTIPVKGRAESLNVASAAAVCIFEYVRQRDVSGRTAPERRKRG